MFECKLHNSLLAVYTTQNVVASLFNACLCSHNDIHDCILELQSQYSHICKCVGVLYRAICIHTCVIGRFLEIFKGQEGGLRPVDKAKQLLRQTNLG